MDFDDIASSILKGFFRSIGYLLAEIFYGTICFWVGWPVCRLFSMGRYPKPRQLVYSVDNDDSGGCCSAVGLFFLVVFLIYLTLFPFD